MKPAHSVDKLNKRQRVFYTKYHSVSFDMIHLLTTIGLSPGGSTHLHTNNT